VSRVPGKGARLYGALWRRTMPRRHAWRTRHRPRRTGRPLRTDRDPEVGQDGGMTPDRSRAMPARRSTGTYGASRARLAFARQLSAPRHLSCKGRNIIVSREGRGAASSRAPLPSPSPLLGKTRGTLGGNRQKSYKALFWLLKTDSRDVKCRKMTRKASQDDTESVAR